MGNVILRVLTENSQWKFGKYADLKIGDILKMDESYLVWMYYNIANISFCPELLTKLRIHPINKPGADLRAYSKHNKEISAEFTEEQRMHGRAKRARIQKTNKKRAYHNFLNATRETKGKRQFYNQGHR